MNEDDIRARLHHAADGVAGPTDLAARAERRYRTRRARRYAGAACVALVVIAGAASAFATTRDGSPEVVVSPATTTIPSARHGISARVELPSDTIVSGSTVEGTIVVENDTGKPIPQTGKDGCGQQWAVALGNDRVHPDILFPLVCVPSTQNFPVGTSRWPFELRVVDQSQCSLPGHPSNPPTRTCAPGADTPLPAGDYRTEFFGGLKALEPSPLTVHVIARVSVRVELPSDTMVTGTSQQGTLVIDNNTGTPIPDEHCTSRARLYLVNGVASSQIHAIADCTAATPNPTLPAGETRRPLTIYARYGSCVPNLPCTTAPRFEESFPPLPPGDYRVELDPGDSGLPALPPMTVHVTAR
jgi:hypothetical protein